MLLRSAALLAVLALISVGPAVGPVRAEGVAAPLVVKAGDTGLPARIAALGETLHVGPTIDVMRDEGLDYGATLEAELFPGRGGDAWKARVAAIYDVAAMRKAFDGAFAAALTTDPARLAEIEAFFGSENGQHIVTLEIAARRALLDQATEDAAKLATEQMMAENSPRLEVIRRFAAANDLIEMNVAGALNANLAFYKGMASGGAFGGEMTEEMMLTDVWSQEPEIRTETESWIYPFLSLAYQPLSDADLQAYVDFSQTAAGKALNAAMFAAFDAVFTSISGELGRSAAHHMQGEDL